MLEKVLNSECEWTGNISFSLPPLQDETVWEKSIIGEGIK